MIQNLIQQLQIQYPRLAEIGAVDMNTADPKVLIAQRQDRKTVTVYVRSSSVPTMLANLGLNTLPEPLTEILNLSQSLFIDIDSVIDPGPLRFYVFKEDTQDSTIDLRYPMQTSVPGWAENNENYFDFSETGIIGFIMDRLTGQVEVYKYYLSKKDGAGIDCYRFSGTGEFINLKTEQDLRTDIPLEILQYFGISDIDLSGYELSYVTRNEDTQSYITIFCKEVQPQPPPLPEQFVQNPILT